MTFRPLSEPIRRNAGILTGFRIFATRPFTLIVTLLLAVVVAVLSFMLLLFPVMAGYYHSVAHGRRETQFIDLESLFAALILLFEGLRRYFFGSYVLGLFGLIPALALSVAPALQLESGTQPDPWWILSLPLLLIPAYFLAGSVVLYGFPRLIQTGLGFHSLGFALRSGRQRFLKVFTLGLILLFPITAVFIHLLMVFSYPIITAWAVSQLVDHR